MAVERVSESVSGMRKERAVALLAVDVTILVTQITGLEGFIAVLAAKAGTMEVLAEGLDALGKVDCFTAGGALGRHFEMDILDVARTSRKAALRIAKDKTE